jgi:hypothetical protein
MENIEWKKVFYNGLETNIEVTKFGRIRRVEVDWYGNHFNSKLGEIDLSKLKLRLDGYNQVGVQIKNLTPKSIKIHQLIASAFLGYKFENKHNLVVDHIDSNKQNNNLENLRIVSQRENSSKEKTIKSGLPVGVYYWKQTNRYYSKIYINKKSIFLGYYDTYQEASQAYQNKLKTN